MEKGRKDIRAQFASGTTMLRKIASIRGSQSAIIAGSSVIRLQIAGAQPRERKRKVFLPKVVSIVKSSMLNMHAMSRRTKK